MGFVDAVFPAHVAFASDFNQAIKGQEALFTGKVKTKMKELHKQFSGNKVYDDALRYLKDMDFKTATASDVTNLTKLVASTAADEGVKIGSKFIGEAAVAWAIGAGYAGAGVYSGGLVTALGVALSWGASSLMSHLWKKEDEHYQPGDLVVITDDTIMGTKHTVRRRRMVHEDAAKLVSTGIVTGESSDGYVPVFPFGKKKVEVLSVEKVAMVPDAEVRKARADSAEFRNLQDTLQELNKPQFRRGRPPHSTKTGDVLEYRGEPAEIVASDNTTVTLKGQSGTVAKVSIGDEEIADGYHTSDYYQGQIGASLNRGQFAWLQYSFTEHMPRAFRNKTHQLVAINSLNRNKCRVFRAWDGKPLNVLRDSLIPYEDAPSVPYSHFLQAVMDGDETQARRYAPGNSNKYFCVTSEPRINQGQVRSRSASPKARKQPAFNYPIPDQDVRDRDYFEYDLAPTDIGGWYDEPEETNSGGTVLVLGVAAVVVGLVFLNR